MALLNSSIIQGSLRVTDNAILTSASVNSLTMNGLVSGNSGHGLEVKSTSTGFYNEGIRIYANDSNYWACLGLGKQDTSYWLGLAVNWNSDNAYFEYKKNGSTTTLVIPHSSGTIVHTGNFSYNSSTGVLTLSM